MSGFSNTNTGAKLSESNTKATAAKPDLTLEQIPKDDMQNWILPPGYVWIDWRRKERPKEQLVPDYYQKDTPAATYEPTNTTGWSKPRIADWAYTVGARRRKSRRRLTKKRSTRRRR